MENIQHLTQKHKKISFIILASYLIFGGCFIFPLSNERETFNFEKLYLIIINYGLLAILFTSLLNKLKILQVYFTSLLFTAIGIFLRYLLEYGEYSNIINFTQINVILYLVITPLLCTFIYYLINKLKVGAYTPTFNYTNNRVFKVLIV